jgi:hypothetical protein
MKPPYIKLYVKDFAFEIQGMTKKQIGEYMLKFLEAYRHESVPDELSTHSIFSELKISLENYGEKCEKNKKNIEKRYSKKNNDIPLESDTCGYQSNENGKPMEYLTKNQEPRTINQELLKKKSIKKKAESETPLDIPSYIPENLLLDFFQHRKNIKKPMTHRAKELLISKIINLYNDGNDPTKLLETAIEHGWQTVYETKETNGRKHNAENWNSGNGTNGAEYQPFNGHQQDPGYVTRLSDYERKMLYVRRNLGLST